ncbi:2-dehydropantoate 2-reductase [Bacillaceae bacterium Marseille-Q3522]|nr:2-dehydropantoate 2-reductase [Bacillaceae bacterium Marseille-Q3522]
MRILVLGAGGVGGYFGGRLVEKGEDVTFLVRKKRKQQLEKNGLVIHSVHGDFSFQAKLITKEENAAPFDLVLFSTKAYHLKDAIDDLKPFIGEKTVVLPLLNGIAHVKALQEELGAEKVIGGLCFIETTLNSEGEIVQTSPAHSVVFGEFAGLETERIRRIAEVLSGTKADFIKSDHIEQDMWHKYSFITVMSGMTTLMRAPVGPIRESVGGWTFIRSLFEEVAQIMKSAGAPIREQIVDEQMKTIGEMTYGMKSSMQRDMEKGYSVEADHLQGHLLKLAAENSLEAPILQTVYQNLKVYEKMQNE